MCETDSDSLPDEFEDRQLLADYRNGDEAAATKLFERYYTRLVGLTRRNMGGFLLEKEESSDIVQSVFRSVFLRGRDERIEVGSGNSLWPLLVTITVNKIRSRVRYWNRERRAHHRQVSLEGLDPLETGPSPEDATRISELVNELCEPFSERRRNIISLLLQDVSVEEVAEIVGASTRTVYRTRHKAMEILKNILDQS